MTRPMWAWRSVLAFGLATPASLVAQEGGSCRPQLERADVVRSLDGGLRQYASGRVLARCLNQATTVSADSVAWYAAQNRMDFVGAVKFRDATVALDAERANYFPREERIDAYGDVLLENRLTGSTLAGPRLNYWREVAGVRDTSELFATGRPTVRYRSGPDPGADPYVIVGERVRLKGRALAWAGGAVTINRSTLAAKSDSAVLALDRGDGALIGHAVTTGGGDATGYRVQGRKIVFRLSQGSVTWVQSWGLAEARSADWRVVGDTIEFTLANDRIQAGAVWGDSTIPQALSVSQSISADSLAIDAPNQQLTEVRGFGRGKAISRDSTAREPDWMVGDTVIAHFDSTVSGGRALIRLEARGNAQAYYHVYDLANRALPPAINYSRGVRIAARFKEEGSLERVDVVDGADGLYLEPAGRREP